MDFFAQVKVEPLDEEPDPITDSESSSSSESESSSESSSSSDSESSSDSSSESSSDDEATDSDTDTDTKMVEAKPEPVPEPAPAPPRPVRVPATKPSPASSRVSPESNIGQLDTPNHLGIQKILACSRPVDQKTTRRRPKRRRVTQTMAQTAGIPTGKGSMHATNATQSHAACVKEQKTLLEQIMEAGPARAQGVVPPAAAIRPLSDMNKLRLIDDLQVDPESIGADMLLRWSTTPEVYRREAAAYGLPVPDEDGAGAETKTAAAASSSSSSSAAAAAAGAAAPQREPPVSTADWPMELVLKRLLKDLPPTTLQSSTDQFDRMTPESTTQYLHDLIRHSVHLPVMESAIADRLLQQSGAWPVPYYGAMVQREFPPCVHGEACCGMTVRFPGKGRGILMAHMSEQEYDAFIATCTKPRGIEKRVCVLCYRRYINKYMVIVSKSKTRIPNAPAVMQYWSIRMDTPGGYTNSACIKPVDTEQQGVPFNGFVCPFVGFRISDYVVRQSSDGRLRWDQSAIVVPGRRQPYPMPGQRLSDFLWRVTLEQRLSRKTELDYTRSMIRTFHPIVCLARDYPARFIDVFPWTKDVPLNDIQPDFLVPLSPSQMQDALVRLERALETTQEREWQHLKGIHQLFGDVRFGDWYARVVGRPISDALRVYLRTLSPNVFSLGLNIHAHLRQCVFWYKHPPGASTDFVFILNKVLPQPCSTRIFFTMLNDFVAKTAHGDQLVRNICFLALLGSYYYHPPPYRRYELVASDELKVKEDVASMTDDLVFSLRCLHFERPDALTTVYVQTPSLAQYSIRALLYQTLRDQPVFYEQLEETMCISSAENVVNEFVVYYRHAIKKHMPHDTWLKLMRADADAEWMKTCERIQAEVDRVTLEPGTRRSKQESIRDLQQQKESAMKRVIVPKVIEVMNGPHVETENLHLCCKRRRCRPPAILSLHTSKWPEEPDLPLEIHRVMDEWMQHVGDRSVDPMDLAQQLYHFPVSREGLGEILKSLRDFDELRMNDRGLNDVLHVAVKPARAAESRNATSATAKRLRQPLFIKWPYTVAIVRLFSRLYGVHRSCAVFPLPRHIIHAQMDALRRRWLLRPEEPVPLHDSMLLWCRVCQYVYNILKSIPKRAAASKSRKVRVTAAGGAVGTRERTIRAQRHNEQVAKDYMTNQVASQRRGRVSQRSSTNKRRASSHPWATTYDILDAFHQHVSSSGQLDHMTMAGTPQAMDQLNLSLRSIQHFEDLTKGESKAKSSNHVLHATHAQLEAKRYLRVMATM